MIKVIIAGSRDFNDYKLLKESCVSLFHQWHLKPSDITIVSGTARGADSMGEQLANEFGIKVERYPADWDAYGKTAGYKRNEKMAEVSDTLIAFWDGRSRGTGHMIDLAKKHKLNVNIVRYDLIKED